MDDATRALVELAHAVAAGDAVLLADAIDAAAERAEPGQVEEALVQSYLFVGYPATLNALAAWRARSGHTALAPSLEGGEPAAEAALWAERGRRVCERVYGGQYERLRANIAALHPDMERWMVVEGYGKVLGREGLPLPVRELCIVAMLAAQDAEPQLYAHLRGALNAGADIADVAAVVALLESKLDDAGSARLRATWDAVRERVHARAADERRSSR